MLYMHSPVLRKQVSHFSPCLNHAHPQAASLLVSNQVNLRVLSPTEREGSYFSENLERHRIPLAVFWAFEKPLKSNLKAFKRRFKAFNGLLNAFSRCFQGL